LCSITTALQEFRMTEISYVWPPGVGDASAEPYDVDEFREYINMMFGLSANGFVVPGYGNELAITASSPASAVVHVGTGALMLKGARYVNDADIAFTIAANASGNPRIDTIVARIDWSAQTVRMAVVAGTPAAVPSPTAPVTNFGVTWEYVLGHVWVANGFASIADAEIHDLRLFTNPSGVAGGADVTNLIVNSEMMSWSGLNIATKEIPDYWTQVGTFSAVAEVTKKSQMSRGRSVGLTVSAANSGLRQVCAVQGNQMHSLRFLGLATAPAMLVVTVTSDGASPLNITKNLRRTGSEYDYFLYFRTPSDATIVTVSILNGVNTSAINIGQVMLIPGYVPGPYRQFHETLYFCRDYFLLQNINGMTTGNGKTVDVDAVDTNNLVPAGTRWLKIIYSIGRISGGATSLNLFPRLDNSAAYESSPGVMPAVAWNTADGAYQTVTQTVPYRPGVLITFDITSSASPVSLDAAALLLIGIET
jgi:hypothetical protein